MRKSIILTILITALVSLFISCDNEKGIFTQIMEDERPIDIRILDAVAKDSTYLYLSTGGVCDAESNIILENTADRIAHQFAYCDGLLYVLYSNGEVCSYDDDLNETVLAGNMNMLTRKGHYFKASGLPVLPLESDGAVLACSAGSWYLIDDIANGITVDSAYLSTLTPILHNVKTPLSFVKTATSCYASDNAKLYELGTELSTGLPSGMGNSKAVAFTADEKLYFLSLTGSSNVYEFTKTLEKKTMILKRTDGPTVSIQPVSIFQESDTSALVATLNNGIYRLLLSEGEIRAEVL